MAFSNRRVSLKSGRAMSALVASPILLAVGAFGAAGCSSNNDATPSVTTTVDAGGPSLTDGAATGADDATSTTEATAYCTDNQVVLGTPNDTYAPNMNKGGANGYQVVLVSADPAPPHHGTATWVIRVLDPWGNPVTNATLNMPNPYMPEHTHNTTVTPSIAAAAPDGTYTINDIYYFMPGNWQLTVRITGFPASWPDGGSASDAAPTDAGVDSAAAGDAGPVLLDTVTFDFCVPS